jgi:hypothetical protein
MDDILPLININIPYIERIRQITNILKHPNNYLELNLTIVSSTLRYEKNTFIITPKGLKNSKRNATDGIVLFGYERSNRKSENRFSNNDNTNTDNNMLSKNNLNSESFNDEYGKYSVLENDFSFPIEEKEDNFGLYELPNFAIYYNVNDGNYYIKDFNTGVGALMRIKKYIMGKNTLINIGGNYLVIYIEKKKIIIKIFNNNILDSPSKQDKNDINCDLKEYDIDENRDFCINIGRNQNCDIIIEDMMLSKIQCHIEYNSSDKCFYLIDGDGQKDSTNGTWVFILNPTKITNNFMFKAEHTLFLANLINISKKE